MDSLYNMAYGAVLFFFTALLAILLIRTDYKEALDLYENGDPDEDGGWGELLRDCPDIPLPPGIGLPVSDWEPEYNKRKEYA